MKTCYFLTCFDRISGCRNQIPGQHTKPSYWRQAGRLVKGATNLWKGQLIFFSLYFNSLSVMFWNHINWSENKEAPLPYWRKLHLARLGLRLVPNNGFSTKSTCMFSNTGGCLISKPKLIWKALYPVEAKLKRIKVIKWPDKTNWADYFKPYGERGHYNTWSTTHLCDAVYPTPTSNIQQIRFTLKKSTQAAMPIRFIAWGLLLPWQISSSHRAVFYLKRMRVMLVFDKGSILWHNSCF